MNEREKDGNTCNIVHAYTLHYVNKIHVIKNIFNLVNYIDMQGKLEIKCEKGQTKMVKI